MESLVIIDKFAMVNSYPSLVHTARHVSKTTGSPWLSDLYYVKSKLNNISRWLRDWEGLKWSRNMVVVGEPAAGVIFIKEIIDWVWYMLIKLFLFFYKKINPILVILNPFIINYFVSSSSVVERATVNR